MDKKTAALKLAHAFLVDNRHYITANERTEYLEIYDKAIDAVEKAMAQAPTEQEQPAQVSEPRKQCEPAEDGVCERLDCPNHGPEQQEPVAWGNFKEDGTLVGLSQHPEDQANWTGRKPPYTSPPASKPWVGLTDEDRAICVQATVGSGDAVQLMCAIEAMLREKNNG